LELFIESPKQPVYYIEKRLKTQGLRISAWKARAPLIAFQAEILRYIKKKGRALAPCLSLRTEVLHLCFKILDFRENAPGAVSIKQKSGDVVSSVNKDRKIADVPK
jgi:hypothetical protein